MGLDRLYVAYIDDPLTRRAKEQLGKGLRDWLQPYFASRFGEERARDLTQSTIEIIWIKLPAFSPEHDQAFARWVNSIARFLTLRARNDDGIEGAYRDWRELDVARVRHPGTGPSTQLRRLDDARALVSELRRLDSKHRRAIEDQLRGGDIESFARHERLRSATVRTHRYRGRETLRRRIADRQQSSATFS